MTLELKTKWRRGHHRFRSPDRSTRRANSHRFTVAPKKKAIFVPLLSIKGLQLAIATKILCPRGSKTQRETPSLMSPHRSVLQTPRAARITVMRIVTISWYRRNHGLYRRLDSSPKSAQSTEVHFKRSYHLCFFWLSQTSAVSQRFREYCYSVHTQVPTCSRSSIDYAGILRWWKSDNPLCHLFLPIPDESLSCILTGTKRDDVMFIAA